MMANARAMSAAAEHGDLRENSEWKSALEERDILRARAVKLQEEIARARIIRPEEVPTDSVGIGSKVLLRRVADGRELEMSFLGAWDSDIDRGLYSYQTGVGQELMGKRVGDTIQIRFEGMEGEYRIDSLGSAL
jgi:transcription elongation GreA/GreB family factor